MITDGIVETKDAKQQLFAQSALVRLRKVSVHRVLGWFGAALAATMFISGIVVTPVMMRFDITVLRRVTVRSFLSILWCDMIIFGACIAVGPTAEV